MGDRVIGGITLEVVADRSHQGIDRLAAAGEHGDAGPADLARGKAPGIFDAVVRVDADDHEAIVAPGLKSGLAQRACRDRQRRPANLACR